MGYLRDILGYKVGNGAVVFELPGIPDRRGLDKVVLSDLPCRIRLAVDLDVFQEAMSVSKTGNSQEEEDISRLGHLGYCETRQCQLGTFSIKT